ncbi:MAG: hypothetical protein JWN08_3127 [Frankiales bacterium]|nr:hypothetical protein [Frankiales bacterium]
MSTSSDWPSRPAPDDVAGRLRWYADVARWAPSKHNSQPWRFVVDGGELEVWADPSRALPDTDRQGRELVLACGCALHLLCVAVRAAGRRPRVEVLPQGHSGPLARVVEGGPWPTSDQDRALLAAVPRRRTDRGPLDATPLPPDLPFRLQDAAQDEGAVLRLVSTPGELASLARLVEQADRLLLRSGTVDRELERWHQHPGDGRQDGVPVTSSRGQAASARADLVQRDFTVPGAVAAHDRPGRDQPLVAVLCTPADRPADWLAAGRALAAVLLLATTSGANASYADQPVEAEQLRGQLQEQLALPGPPQLVLRLGVGGQVDAPPRRDLDEVLFSR